MISTARVQKMRMAAGRLRESTEISIETPV